MKLLHKEAATTGAPPAGAEALIREARRLRRRRWSIGISLLLLAGTGVGIGLGTSGAGGGRRPPVVHAGSNPATPVLAVQPGVTMLNLTKSDKYGDVALAGGKMVLYGPASQEADPSASAACNSAVVNPVTLQLSGLRSGSCADPALEGQRVIPVMTVEPEVPFGNGGVATVTVRISRVVPGSPGYGLGPVVMSFPQESDGWPAWVYGDGDLWLFDALSARGSELLRISGTTGDIMQRLAMPAVSRPIIAYDTDGLWLAPAANSGGAGVGAVYHVAPGARAAERVFTLPGGQYAAWMVAAGHSLWLDVGPTRAFPVLWHLVGASATPAGPVALSPLLENALMVRGGPSGMVGDESDGLWTVVPDRSGTAQQVLRLAPGSGASSTVAVLKPAYSSPDDVLYGAWKAVTYHGSMYLLDPPAASGVYPYQSEGFSALYRITPKG